MRIKMLLADSIVLQNLKSLIIIQHSVLSFSEAKTNFNHHLLIQETRQ